MTILSKDKPYTVLVNGQTGKVVGTLPWENKRIWAIAASIFVLIVLFTGFFFTGFLPGVLRFFRTFYMHATIIIMASSLALFTKGIMGLKRVFRNLRLTQSEGIFNFVKRRQS